MTRKIYLLALIAACSAKKTVTSPPASNGQLAANRAAGLPDDAANDASKAPATLTVTYSRADATASLLWTHPAGDVGASFHYEIYGNQVDSNGNTPGASQLLLSADSSVVSAVVDVATVAGDTPIFNVVVRQDSASREAAAASGNRSNVAKVITRHGAATVAAECRPSSGSTDSIRVFAAELDAMDSLPARPITGASANEDGATQENLQLQGEQIETIWADKANYIVTRTIDGSVTPIAGSGTTATDVPLGAYLPSGMGLLAVVTPTSLHVLKLVSGTTSELLTPAQMTPGFAANTIGVTWVAARPNQLLVIGQDPSFSSFSVTSYDFNVNPPATQTASVPVASANVAASPLIGDGGIDGIGLVNASASESGAVFPYGVSGAQVMISASLDAVSGNLSAGAIAISGSNVGSFVFPPRLTLDAAQQGSLAAISDNGQYVATLGHDDTSATATPPCLIVVPVSANVLLSSADFSACQSNSHYTALALSYAYTGSYSDDTAGSAYFLPSAFGHGKLLIEDVQAGAPASWNVVTISGAVPTIASGGTLATCPTGASQSSFWYYQSLSDPNADAQKLALLCTGQTFGYAVISDLAPLATTVPVLPTQSGLSFAAQADSPIEPFAVGIEDYDSGAATPLASLRVLDLRSGTVTPVDASLTTTYVEDDGVLLLSGDAKTALFSNFAYNFDTPFTQDSSGDCSDFSDKFLSGGEASRLTLLRSNGSVLLVKAELLSMLPAGAPAGTPFFINPPVDPPGADYVLFTLGFFAAGDVVNCDSSLGGSVGIDPAKIRVYGIDLKTCNDIGCTMNDLTPTDWQCGAGATIEDVRVSINPISFSD